MFRIKETKLYRNLTILSRVISALKRDYINPWRRTQYGYMAPTSHINIPFWVSHYPSMFLYENTNIYEYSKFILAPDGGKFIMKKNSGAAMGLTVVTGNHSVSPTIGKWHKEDYGRRKGDVEKDVIVEEDVWLAANVTLLAGVTVGRGAIVGAGAVVRQSLPPYSISMGNPAKVVGFKFTPDEIIEHERNLYPEGERLDEKILHKNYEKYFSKRIVEISKFVKL